MSKLMSVMGIILLAVGLALALVGLVNPAQMQVYGLSLDTAATLFVGGVLAVGLGGVIGALQQGVPALVATVEEAAPVIPAVVEQTIERVETVVVPEPAVETPAPAYEPPPSRVRFNPFSRKTAEVATGVAAGAAATVAAASETVQETAAATVATGKSAVDDTIAALEQAKADIANAIGGVSSITDDKVEAAVEDIADDIADADEEPVEETIEDGELYVVEEREIRGRPARILSDNTVEAETDEGWMRFENLEHLNEYMDAMEVGA